MLSLMFVAVLVVPVVSGTRSQGLFSGSVPGGRLVFPRKVSDDDGFVGDQSLEHHHDRTHHHRRRVRRLAVDGGGPWVPDMDSGDDPAVQYELPLDEDFPDRLLLWPSTSFMAPTLRVDLPGSRRRRRAVRSTTSCHFRGYVRGDWQSSVALSACGQGLVGLIKTKKAQYWLEPSANGGNSTGSHIVFQRGKGKKKKYKARGRRKGRRRGERRRRRRHGKDCGTRDPQIGNRTAIAWGRGVDRLVVQVRRGRGKGGAGRSGRRPRSVSVEKHVEVLVVADHTMTAFHQDGDLETYLLTIMNMVSALYHDPSIGNLINLAVVRIVIMDEWAGEDSFNSTVNADRTLTSFCRWATQNNLADESDPHHHDVAVLITRVDICARRDSPCNTLGVAHVGGMCTADRACSVNQDNGIVLAHTIAHEMGHNFGMPHDTESTGCPRKVDNVIHVMTPTFEADNHRMAWSPCSRRMITAFLDEGKGECLDDAPTLGGFQYPDLPAGSMYDAEHQCRLQFGSEEASVCSDVEEVCTRLWCEVDGECTTLLQPAAPGTACGKHKWCLDQQCTEISDLPEPVPGGWSSWGEWGPCSRTCGAGLSVMERRCDHPTPRHGGAYCLGERRRYRVCNTQACLGGAPSFRAVQCAAYNNRTYHGTNYTWLPYFDSSEPCELYCADSEDTVIVPWGGAVADGTPCNVGRRDMCIGHVCRKVGCDWTVDSDAVEDRCGVCHGDGSQCDTVTGMYNQPDGYGYKEAVIIPSGARNVHIAEVLPARNFIGIGSTTKSVFYLNGRRKITLPGEYDVAGTVALYERLGDLETVKIPGPLLESILLYVIFRGNIRNPGVRYEYTVRRPGVVSPSLAWQWTDWTPCSATCGGGRQELRAVCTSTIGSAAGRKLTLPDEECEMAIGQRPSDKNRTCATHACPAMWWSGPWQLCSATCGDSVSRRRSVLCVRRGRQDMALPDEECDQETRPAEQERCHDVPSCPVPGNFSDHGSPESNADIFSVTLSRPSAVSRPKDVLELDGLDLDNLEQDERDFLNTNYTTFFQDVADDTSQILDETAVSPSILPSPSSPSSPYTTNTPFSDLSNDQRFLGSKNPYDVVGGVWEDDMDVSERPARERLRTMPVVPRDRPRKRLSPGRRVDRGKAHQGLRRRRKHGKAKHAHPNHENVKDTFFLMIE